MKDFFVLNNNITNRRYTSLIVLITEIWQEDGIEWEVIKLCVCVFVCELLAI